MGIAKFAFAAALALVVLPIASPVVSALADSPPKLDVTRSCEAAARGAVSLGRDREACLGDERTAQETLTGNWSKYSQVHKTQCVGMTTQGGPSYVELISCLEIMRDAAEIRKADPFYGAADEKPKRPQVNHHARRHHAPRSSTP
jgi:hypothetical protein